jgi:hypothetical protein
MATTGESLPQAQVRMPAGWTFAALVAGLALGWVLADGALAEPVLAVAQPVGTVWLRALQMTIVPLVAALLVTGIARTVATRGPGAWRGARCCCSSRCSLLAPSSPPLSCRPCCRSFRFRDRQRRH